MCGRFTLTRPAQEISEQFKLNIPEQAILPHYNAAPAQQLWVITNHGPRSIKTMHWGFLLSRDEKTQLIINARAESLDKKPLFRQKLKSSRCIIPADGFFEWQKNPDKKQPFRFTLKDKSLFAFAGLYGEFKAPDGNIFQAFTIITTEANQLVAQLHTRMPVILSPPDALRWLSDEKVALEGNMLKPFASEAMMSYKVNPKVNSSANDAPELIEPWTDPGLTLF